MEFTRVAQFFHQINRVLPDGQTLLTLAPRTPARDAVALLRAQGYSQAPVIVGTRVLGVFSHRSYASGTSVFTLEDIQRLRAAPGDLPVEEFIEQFEYSRVTDELQDAFGPMENDSGVLIGSPEKLQGVLTPMDFLRYLYGIASPFVLLSEIELSLRALIQRAVDAETLVQCAKRSLKSLYKDEAAIPLCWGR